MLCIATKNVVIEPMKILDLLQDKKCTKQLRGHPKNGNQNVSVTMAIFNEIILVALKKKHFPSRK